MILNEKLPSGLAANTAAILGISLGENITGLSGDDVQDGSGILHPGIVTFPVPVLKAPGTVLQKIMEECRMNPQQDLSVFDFCAAAQSSRTYAQYQEKMKKLQTGELEYFGLVLFGESRKVTHLSGSLPLYR